MIETDYQALEIATQPTDNIKNIEFCGLYTWLFNSSDESAQDFLTKEIENLSRHIFLWGPLWSLDPNLLRLFAPVAV